MASVGHAARNPPPTRLLVLVWIAGLLQELAWSLMVHFPGLLSDFGASEAGIGLLYSLSAVFGLLLRPMLGRLMDNLGTPPRTYVDVRGIGSVGVFFPTYGGVAIVVRIGSSACLDRLRQLPLIITSVSLYALGLLSLGMAGSDLQMGMAAALLGSGHGLLFPVLTA